MYQNNLFKFFGIPHFIDIIYFFNPIYEVEYYINKNIYSNSK